MIRFKLAVVAGFVGLVLSIGVSQAQVQLSLSSSAAGDSMMFSGGSFTVGGFQVTAPGQDSGILGSITGTFSFSPTSPQNNTWYSSVTGSGTLNLGGLQGTVTFPDVLTINSAGSLNNVMGQALINVTDLQYNPPGLSNSDLATLAAAGSALLDLSFTLQNGSTLENLYNASPSSPIPVSFNGTLVSAIPEPSSLLAGALMVLPLGISAIRILRKS